MEPLEGIAEADAHLGRRVPLPSAALPLVRWVDVYAVGPGAVEIAFNLDDTRAGSPGRLSLYVGTVAPEARELVEAAAPRELGDGLTHVSAPLAEAQPSLRPVHVVHWADGGLHLRLTAQGPWTVDQIAGLARSVR